jgi:hypothetical protein
MDHSPRTTTVTAKPDTRKNKGVASPVSRNTELSYFARRIEQNQAMKAFQLWIYRVSGQGFSAPHIPPLKITRERQQTAHVRNTFSNRYGMVNPYRPTQAPLPKQKFSRRRRCVVCHHGASLNPQPSKSPAFGIGEEQLQGECLFSPITTTCLSASCLVQERNVWELPYFSSLCKTANFQKSSRPAKDIHLSVSSSLIRLDSFEKSEASFETTSSSQLPPLIRLGSFEKSVASFETTSSSQLPPPYQVG